MPLIVRAAARLLSTLARSIVAWAIVLTAAFLLLALLGDDDMPWTSAVFGPLVFWLPAHGVRVLLDRLAAALLAGRGYFVLVGR